MENETKLKEKILKSLKPKRKFCVRWAENLWYEKEVEAVDREDAERMFKDGEIEADDGDVYDSDFLGDTFEVDEV